MILLLHQAVDFYLNKPTNNLIQFNITKIMYYLCFLLLLDIRLTQYIYGKQLICLNLKFFN